MTAFLLGLVVGSFLNVVIYRLPRALSVVTPRSHCPRCGTTVRWFDNIPLLSFLLLGGRCRSCHAAISWQYPLVELITGSLAFALSLKFGASGAALLYFFLLVCPLVAISFIDLHHKIIPDLLSLPGMATGLITQLVLKGVSWQTLFNVLGGILAGGGTLYLIGWLYEKTRHREGLGMGDVKLAAMFGAFFGWKAVFLILLLSSFIGSVVGLGFILIRRKGLQFEIPYGPFLSAGAIFYLFWGPKLITLYLDWVRTPLN